MKFKHQGATNRLHCSFESYFKCIISLNVVALLIKEKCGPFEPCQRVIWFTTHWYIWDLILIRQKTVQVLQCSWLWLSLTPVNTHIASSTLSHSHFLGMSLNGIGSLIKIWELLIGMFLSQGELTMTGDMENLQNAIYLELVPDSWSKRAYASTCGLTLWFTDLLCRIRELESWTSDFSLPSAVWLAGFFNPQSFLTAIMQSTARRNEWPLDKMSLQCDVTKKNREEFSSPPREGAYVHGLFMEGARWDTQVRGKEVIIEGLWTNVARNTIVFVIWQLRNAFQWKKDTAFGGHSIWREFLENPQWLG